MLGWHILRYGTVDSTQHVAAARIADGTPHRTAVVAQQQTAGYGRKGDVWHDVPDASLLVTLIVRPPPTVPVIAYGMAAALAVIGAIADVSGGVATLKWPNDVLLGGRKVAGILGDATWRGGTLIALRVGIGINLCGTATDFVAHGLPDATSIAVETGAMPAREQMLDAMLRHFGQWDDLFAAGEGGTVAAAWRQSVGTIGQQIYAKLYDGQTLYGVAQGVTDGGSLIVLPDSGAESVTLDASSVRSMRHRAMR